MGIPFLIDSYIFSPVPWKGKDPLRRIKRITPERDNAIISLHTHSMIATHSVIATNHEHECVVVQLKPTLQTLYEVPSI